MDKIDSLFKENLEGIELKPSAGSWDEVMTQVDQSTSYKVYWRIAALICVVIGIGYLVILGAPQEMTIAGISIDGPQVEEPLIIPEIELPLMAAFESQQIVVEKVPEELPEEVIELPVKMPMMELGSHEGIALVAANDYLITDLSGVHIKEPTPIVSIKYMASATSESEDASRNKLGRKILNYAMNTQPADMMADLRDAKDQLLSKGLSFD
ncbi:MAG: hypothetical protein JXQ90_19345 [Cyclobacteriaceae bacterium]